MTRKDIQTGRAKDDVVGVGSYNSDSHDVQRVPTARRRMKAARRCR